MKPATFVLIACLILEIVTPDPSQATGQRHTRNTDRVRTINAAGDSQKEPESMEVGNAEIVDVAIERIEKSPTVRYKTHSIAGGWAESGWIVGTLVVAKQDTFAIRTRTGLRQVPLSSIRELAVSSGRYKNTDNGIKFGLIVGGAILLPVAILDASGKVDYFRRGTMTRKVAVRVSLPIFLGSTLVGAATKSHKWIEVAPHRLLDLCVAPALNGGLRAALSLSF